MLSHGFILSAVCTHFAIFGVSFTVSYSNKYSIIYVWFINHAVISVSLGFALSKKILYQNGKAEQIIYMKHFIFLLLPGNLWSDWTYFKLSIICTFPTLTTSFLTVWTNYRYPKQKLISFTLQSVTEVRSPCLRSMGHVIHKHSLLRNMKTLVSVKWTALECLLKTTHLDLSR